MFFTSSFYLKCVASYFSWVWIEIFHCRNRFYKSWILSDLLSTSSRNWERIEKNRWEVVYWERFTLDQWWQCPKSQFPVEMWIQILLFNLGKSTYFLLLFNLGKSIYFLWTSFSCDVETNCLDPFQLHTLSF